MSFAPIAITGVGGVSAVGDCAAQTCASVRAGISGYAEFPYFPTTRDPGWDAEAPLIAAVVGGVDPMRDGASRLQDLAGAALRDLIDDSGLSRVDFANAALLAALPVDDEVSAPWGLSDVFLPELCDRLALSSFPSMRTSTSGHTGAFELLAAASDQLASGDYDRVVLLAVDSNLIRARLDRLDSTFRIRSLRNVDGFIPGEAAFALLLESAESLRAAHRTPRAVITSVGLGDEDQTFQGERQSTANGLCDAIRGAVDADPEVGVDWVMCDLNGESYRGFEWGVTTTRLGDSFRELGTPMHPADCYGDIGAASGAGLLAVAAAAFQRGWAPTEEALLWTSADGSRRAAVCVEPD